VERVAEADRFYYCVYNADIDDVHDLYPDLNLDALTTNDVGEKQAEGVSSSQSLGTKLPPTAQPLDADPPFAS
jgi:hypothetical protein